MYYIGQDFQEFAECLSTRALVLSGASCVLLGLVIWLTGVCFRGVLAGAVAAVIAAACGFLLFGHNTAASAILLSALAFVISIAFERLAVTILSALLAAVLCLCTLASFNNLYPQPA